LIAGHETTSGLLSFAIYFLLKNPEVLERARGLVDEVLGDAVPELSHLGKLRYIWVTLTPSVWLVAVTMTASYQKIFSANPRIGFLAQARQMAERLATGSIAPDKVVETERLIFNAQLNAGVTALLAGLVIVVVLSAAWEWYRLLSGRRASDLQETPYVATQFALGD